MYIDLASFGTRLDVVEPRQEHCAHLGGKCMKRLYAAMVLVGIATTMLGPLLPGFIARGGLDDAHAGLLFTAQFLASVVTAAMVGPLSKRFGYRALIAAGLVLVTLGVAACAGIDGSWLSVCVALYGCGLGLSIPAANLAAAAIPGQSGRLVMWINLSWSLGAVIAPWCVAGLRGAFLWTLAAGVLAVAAAVATIAREPRPVESGQRTHGMGSITLTAAVLLFLYTGSESSLGGWLSSYALRTPDSRGLWAVLPSIFWGAMLAARLPAPALLARFGARKVALAGILGALAGVALLVTATGPATMVAATVLAGIGMAPIFPVVVAQYADLTGGGAAAGLIFSAAGMGGAMIPPLVGVLATMSGSLRAGLAVVMVWIVGMIGLEWRLSR